jgi:hypothetical protein
MTEYHLFHPLYWAWLNDGKIDNWDERPVIATLCGLPRDILYRLNDHRSALEWNEKVNCDACILLDFHNKAKNG